MRSSRNHTTVTLLLGLFSLSLLGCAPGEPLAPTPAPPTGPNQNVIDPAGVWTFHILVTSATGVCDGEEGDSSSEPITITKTGTAPPYDVTASGFLGVATNVLTGTFDASNRLILDSGSYPEENGTTTPTYDLTATSPNQMVGVETWNWVGPSGDCPGSTSSISATRNDG